MNARFEDIAASVVALKVQHWLVDQPLTGRGEYAARILIERDDGVKAVYQQLIEQYHNAPVARMAVLVAAITCGIHLDKLPESV